MLLAYAGVSEGDSLSHIRTAELALQQLSEACLLHHNLRVAQLCGFNPGQCSPDSAASRVVCCTPSTGGQSDSTHHPRSYTWHYSSVADNDGPSKPNARPDPRAASSAKGPGSRWHNYSAGDILRLYPRERDTAPLVVIITNLNCAHKLHYSNQ
jgi:hypothetical protein